MYDRSLIGGRYLTPAWAGMWQPKATFHDPDPPIRLADESNFDLEIAVTRPPLFVRLQWPDPWAAVQSQFGIGRNTALLTTTAAAQPVSPTDWTVPRDAEWPTILRTLIGVVREAPVVQQPPVYEWPVPRGAEFKQPQLLDQMAPFRPAAAERPPVANDFGLLREPDFPTALRTLVDQSVEFRPQRPPFGYDYPVPKGAEYPTSLLLLINQVVQFQPAAEAPPFTYDWPLLRQAEFPIELRTLIGGVTREAVAERPPIGAQWEVPQRAEFPIGLRTWINAAVQAALQRPPINYDYPLVMAPEARIELRHWSNGVVREQPAVPPFNYQYPVPQGAQYPVGLLTWVTGFQVQFQGAPTRPPITNYEWPILLGAVFPTRLRGFVSFANPAFIPAPPAAPGELRNPQFIGNTTGQMSTWGTW